MSTAITRYHSCIRCQQRKIKCDGQVPCAACRKADADCKRTDRNTPGTRRRRVDLRSTSVRPRPRLETPNTNAHISSGFTSLDGDLISPPGSVPQQMFGSVVDDPATNPSLPLRVESILFDHVSTRIPSDLEWPQPVQIFQLWQIYIDNVNPMTNLLHVQTMQRVVLEAASCRPEELPKESLALLSSICLTAIESLGDDDCQKLLKASKHECVHRFSATTKEYLIGAGLMETASMEVLQALVLYLVSLTWF